MIRYALVCQCGAAFDSWFQTSEAFDAQASRGLIHCPACDSTSVEKALMAPHLARTKKGARGPRAPREEAATPAPPSSASDTAPAATATPATTPPSVPGQVAAAAAAAAVAVMSPQERELRAKLKELRTFITKNAEHVGPRFPEEARRMHYGETAHRSIYGEASLDEARALLDEGIELQPLPPLPDDQN